MKTKMLLRFAIMFILVGIGLIWLSRNQTVWFEQLYMGLGCHSAMFGITLLVIDWYLEQQRVKEEEGDVWQSDPGLAVKTARDEILTILLSSAPDFGYDKLSSIIRQFKAAGAPGVPENDIKSITSCIGPSGNAFHRVKELADPNKALHAVGQNVQTMRKRTDHVTQAVRRYVREVDTASENEKFALFMDMWMKLDELVSGHQSHDGIKPSSDSSYLH